MAEIPRLRRHARALVGDPQRADDLVQDCLERALGRLHQWRVGSNLRAWLFTIMHNLFVNMVRRERLGPSYLPPERLDVAGDDDPSDALSARDVERALAALSPDHREIILLVGLEQLSYRDTARVLGVPMGTVMSRLARARRRLASAIETGAATPLRRVK